MTKTGTAELQKSIFRTRRVRYISRRQVSPRVPKTAPFGENARFLTLPEQPTDPFGGKSLGRNFSCMSYPKPKGNF